MENSTNKRTVNIGKDALTFQFGDKEIALRTGTDFISKTFFASEYPNEAEIEKALNHIEYDLTDHKELINNNETLVCTNTNLADILVINGSKVVTKQIIEEAFDKYIDCAYGEPAPLLGIDYNLEKLCTIIIVRSIMYYLKFDEVIVSK